jgi:D-3-phosphoglycerate dehydrogenase / 2-oxoglutarate reductase
VTQEDGYRVLVKEKIAASGVELLRREFEVVDGTEWEDVDLKDRIADYDAIIIRSGTQLTADLIERAKRLKVIGRAGIGVDNVDVDAATKRGIVVANAPESNTVAAAEHTMAMMLALCRNVPQAHASLTGGAWERSKFAGIEVYRKTLGVIGFGRIGQLVAERAKAFGMTVIAFDPFVAAERYRELGVERVEASADIYARADVITLHLPKTPDTVDWLGAPEFGQMKDGVLIVNCARGELIDLNALEEALRSGKAGGAALDVFPEEPLAEHPLFELPNVVVTPHLGASTAEAQDRAGVITAEQVVAALSGGLVTNAVNIPTVKAEDMEVLGPFLPLCTKLGKLGMALAEASSVDRIEVRYEGRLSELDTRLLTISVLNGVLEGHTEESVNLVNAAALAEERGIAVAEHRESESESFNELVAVAVVSNGNRVEVAGTGFGPRNVPHLVSVYGQSFNIEIADHFAFFRYLDQPGMIGRVGTIFGQHGVNIHSAAVGAEEGEDQAVMAVTTDGPVPLDLIEEIAALDGFHDGRAVSL